VLASWRARKTCS